MFYIWELFWGFICKVFKIVFMVNLIFLNLFCSLIRKMFLLLIYVLWFCFVKLYGFGVWLNCLFFFVECCWLNCLWCMLYLWSVVMVIGKFILFWVVRFGILVDVFYFMWVLLVGYYLYFLNFFILIYFCIGLCW